MLLYCILDSWNWRWGGPDGIETYMYSWGSVFFSTLTLLVNYHLIRENLSSLWPVMCTLNVVQLKLSPLVVSDIEKQCILPFKAVGSVVSPPRRKEHAPHRLECWWIIVRVRVNVVIWRSGSALASMNKVHLRRARLVGYWVGDRVLAQLLVREIYLGI